MKVIYVPLRLRAATASLLLTVPLAAMQVMLVEKAHWWNLPVRSLTLWTSISLIVSLYLILTLGRGFRRSLKFCILLGMVWCVVSAWLTIVNRQPALGFFSILLAWYWGGMLYWLQNELTRSYFDPQVEWFHGAPKPIPGLVCQIDEQDFRACRLDKEGVFVFREKAGEKVSYPKKKKIPIVLSFRGRSVKCAGFPIAEAKQISGVGLQFSEMGVDVKKELSDFVEHLQGEGYV